MGQNQWYHFGVCAPPILVFFSGDWDVHWGYDLDFDPWPHCCSSHAVPVGGSQACACFDCSHAALVFLEGSHCKLLALDGPGIRHGALFQPTVPEFEVPIWAGFKKATTC